MISSGGAATAGNARQKQAKSIIIRRIPEPYSFLRCETSQGLTKVDMINPQFEFV